MNPEDFFKSTPTEQPTSADLGGQVMDMVMKLIQTEAGETFDHAMAMPEPARIRWMRAEFVRLTVATTSGAFTAVGLRAQLAQLTKRVDALYQQVDDMRAAAARRSEGRAS